MNLAGNSYNSLHVKVYLAKAISNIFLISQITKKKKKKNELCQAGHYTPMASKKM